MHKILFSLFLVVIFYGIYNAQKKPLQHKKDTHQNCQICVAETNKLSILEHELSILNSVGYVKKYIVDVINHGSDTLGFKGGVMEGGYASVEDADKIACYVLKLSGKKSPKPCKKDAVMFYTSICGGCHGDDGKGLGGNYPDLTRTKLLGVARREVFLQEQIRKLKKEKLVHQGEAVKLP